MNFTIANQTKKSPKLSYGLNNRRSILQCESSDSDGDARRNTNRKIREEQDDLRKPTETYDFDAEYESFATRTKPKPKEKKSRYVDKLLEHSKKREREHEIIFERKVAREQMEEEGKEEYKGKEKFVTAAYKKKLKERELWAKEEEVRSRNDDATGGLSSFYSNFTRSFAKPPDDPPPSNETKPNHERPPSDEEKETGSIETECRIVEEKETGSKEKECNIVKEKNPALERAVLRANRAEKIAVARERYLLRKKNKVHFNPTS